MCCSKWKTHLSKHRSENPSYKLLRLSMLWYKWMFQSYFKMHNLYSVQFSCSVMSDSLQPHELQHARPPCPSPTPRVYPNSCPLSRWCHLAISSVVPFSFCLQSFPTSGSFQMSQLFASGGQNIGVSASTSVLPMNTQDWFPLGWTGLISLKSKGPLRVFSTPQFKSISCYQFLLAEVLAFWSVEQHC